MRTRISSFPQTDPPGIVVGTLEDHETQWHDFELEVHFSRFGPYEAVETPPSSKNSGWVRLKHVVAGKSAVQTPKFFVATLYNWTADSPQMGCGSTPPVGFGETAYFKQGLYMKNTIPSATIWHRNTEIVIPSNLPLMNTLQDSFNNTGKWAVDVQENGKISRSSDKLNLDANLNLNLLKKIPSELALISTDKYSLARSYGRVLASEYTTTGFSCMEFVTQAGGVVGIKRKGAKLFGYFTPDAKPGVVTTVFEETNLSQWFRIEAGPASSTDSRLRVRWRASTGLGVTPWTFTRDRFVEGPGGVGVDVSKVQARLCFDGEASGGKTEFQHFNTGRPHSLLGDLAAEYFTPIWTKIITWKFPWK